MKDFLGNELVTGDEIVTLCPDYRFTLSKGTVVGFTPKKVKIKLIDYYGRIVNTTRDPVQVVKARGVA